MGDKKIKEGKMKKSGFCQQARMREDIEVSDLQSVNRHQMMCNCWFGVAAKTKGTTDDEGQIGGGQRM